MDFAFWPACALRRIHTMRQRIGDRSAGGSLPSTSQLDRARTRFSTKTGSITNVEVISGNFLALFVRVICLFLFKDMEHAQMRPLDCMKNTTHQGSTRFLPLSRGNQCTPISYFAVLYSSVVNVDKWLVTRYH